MTARAPGSGATRVARSVLSAPLRPRAWYEAAYCLLGFPVALAGFVVVILLFTVGTGLTASLIGAALGLFVLAAALAVARGLGATNRRLAGSLLGQRIVAPARPRPRPGTGVLGRLDIRLRDGDGWRAAVYALGKLPIAVIGAYAVVWWVIGLLNLLTPLRFSIRGGSVPPITPLPFGGEPLVSTLPGSLVGTGIGVAMLLAAPWLTRGVVTLDQWLMHTLLGPGALAERVKTLEASRALAVDDTAALLRRLERDLHDGAQTRLATLAMSLDMAKQRLGTGNEAITDPAGLRSLIEGAHQSATEALGELRDLLRGIHPPALNEGLDAALQTLTACSTVPVKSTVDISERPTPAIERIAYFCAAELLANVIKHSGASRAVLVVTSGSGQLRLRLTDDGSGGAAPGPDSGLAGLRQRVRTVDGSIHITSPDAGPTSVTVTLPAHA